MSEFNSKSISAAGENVVCSVCGRPTPKQETIPLADAYYCIQCKPQVLQRLSEGKPLVSLAAEEMRKKYLTHEASVKSIGTLYYVSAIFVAVVGTIVAVKWFSEPLPGNLRTDPMAPIVLVGTDALVFGLAIGGCFVANGLRRLKEWARITCGILSGLGLLAFPIGTIVNAYILYLIFSKRGKTVFSQEYQLVIQQTPHIKYKTSIVVWIFFGLLLFLFALAGMSIIHEALQASLAPKSR